MKHITNNMKLYTEEQVRKAIELSRDTHQEGRAYMERDEYDYSMDEVLDLLTPIELPSDEEISIEASNRHYGTNFKHVFASGAKWMKEQILNQNK
jgi:hypothetical protein